MYSLLFSFATVYIPTYKKKKAATEKSPSDT